MDKLDIENLYEQKSESDINKFFDSTDSKINVKTDFEKVEEDTEWIDMIEETIPHIDSIYRNPNRFIVNEEEIVKIELARKITVDSIKNLSQHTNYIQSVDPDTGDVRPSKILNINKEESYDTYENRVLYTLIQNMIYYVSMRKKLVEARQGIQGKDFKQFDYNAVSRFNNDNVNINVHIDSSKINGKANQSDEIMERIQNVEQKITDLTSTDVYKTLSKLHVSLVRPPIKKTNMILKNVNFQYVMRLWNYLQDNMDDKSKHIQDKNETSDNQELKRLADQTFLLNYVALDTLNKENSKEKDNSNKKMVEEITNQMIEQIIMLNPNMTPEELQGKITNKMAVIKYRSLNNITEIQRIFKEHIEKYIEKVEN